MNNRSTLGWIAPRRREIARCAGAADLVLLCAAWIFPTLVGHDPWKPDEAYSFGIVLDQLQRGDWVVPMLAGEPFLEKPPLFFITAGAFARVFGEWLPLHDAARLASGFFLSVALLFLAMTARELHRGRFGWTAVLVMLGCVGLYVRAHQLITDLALLAGVALGIYGLACARHRLIVGGLSLGGGAAIAFLSKGLLGPGILGVSALGLLAFPAWRSATYVRALAVAAAVAFPGIAAWTLALYARSPALFDTWLITNNFGRFFGFVDNNLHQPRFFYAYTILWYAFPALPLAAWTLWHAYRRDGVRTDPAIQLPLVVAAATFGILCLAADARELYLMPLLLPLALLAAAGSETVPPSAVAAVVRPSKWMFGAAAFLLWLGYVAMLSGAPALLAEALADYQRGFVARPSWGPLTLAALATLALIATLRPRVTTARRGIVQWTAGIALCGVIVGTLWFPYLDAGKSYRGMIASLRNSLPEANCVASQSLGEPQRALLEYFARIRTMRTEIVPDADCDVLLVQGSRAAGAPARGRGWTPVWEGARIGDRSEYYRLYVRGAARHAALAHRRGGTGAVYANEYVAAARLAREAGSAILAGE